MERVSTAEARRMLHTEPDAIVYPIVMMRHEFGFPPAALIQELQSGRLRAVKAGLEGEPCVTGADFIAWCRHPDSPGVLVQHVLTHLRNRGRQQ
jgi:hypothetical protein